MQNRTGVCAAGSRWNPGDKIGKTASGNAYVAEIS
jgi:hypothetical protein